MLEPARCLRRLHFLRLQREPHRRFGPEAVHKLVDMGPDELVRGLQAAHISGRREDGVRLGRHADVDLFVVSRHSVLATPYGVARDMATLDPPNWEARSMRDLQHLEELSSATAFGSWVNDVVIALDQARSRDEVGATGRLVLAQASNLIARLAEPQTSPQIPDAARGLAAGETTRSAISAVLGPRGEDNAHLGVVLRALSETARRASAGALDDDDAARVDDLIQVFDRLGSLQLVKSNSVLVSRKNAGAWTATTMT